MRGTRSGAMRICLSFQGVLEDCIVILMGKMEIILRPAETDGGIGQSRLCMLLLGKAHIGEVQSSLWPQGMREICAKNGIELL